MEQKPAQHVRNLWGNVTVDPLSFASPAHDLEIEEVLDCASGEYLDVREWISSWRYEQLIGQRVDIREKLNGSPRFRCPVCAVPVYLVSNQHKRFYFKHQIEDGSCPAQTRHPLSREDILARKYHGLRESEPHRRIKALILRSLLADPRYSGIEEERQWRSARDPAMRRQPDVQADGAQGRLAFEVQLSTTFLDVVVARRTFYRDERALLVWVMGRFDPDYRRLTTDDLLFTNNSNILIVDEETAAHSEHTRRFHVRCHFRRPVRAGDAIADLWESSLVLFDELTWEQDRQRCWHFDYESEAAAIRKAIDAELCARETAAADALRSDLFAFWIDRERNAEPSEEARLTWAEIRQSFAGRGIDLPLSPDSESGFVALMNGLTSAREGRPVGWHFKQLVEVGHRIADAYPEHVAAFGHALIHFRNGDIVEGQDRTGKWKNRRQTIRKSLERGDPDFLPHSDSLSLIGFLLPGVEKKLEKLMLKARNAPSNWGTLGSR
ncbi:MULTISPECIES: DUF6035 family protein [unclassified Mesorhizobium]|uniref:DUF6035 family protein n=1 Tax=unclassified Mesorhizobium TaxID=325217 RepID=UPI000FC9A820|nr:MULTISPECIES: DUF6035 family protein [unclassified Mesorhizobium]RUV67081.1 hypothetical protein EOA78_31655 [Mesorhizobium sp. M5C.F.Cr.IN.023.01.1.1]RWI63559.1 MAG: hypothetical protein EOR18_31315 [Mesorhizobium sp.]